MWNLKRPDTSKLNLPNRNRLSLKRMKLWLPGGRMGERIVREFGLDRYTQLYVKWITNKDLLYSTGNSPQCYVVA